MREFQRCDTWPHVVGSPIRPYPPLRLSLFATRTFRVSVLGGFATRLGVGGMPFLLPLLYQLGLGFPAWQSGLFNSLQFSSMNSLAYADINDADTAMASTLASTLQQMSMSFGLAFGSLITAYFLGGLPQSDRVAVTASLHHAFLALAVLTMVSSAAFWTLRPQDGESVSKGSASLCDDNEGHMTNLSRTPPTPNSSPLTEERRQMLRTSSD